MSYHCESRVQHCAAAAFRYIKCNHHIRPHLYETVLLVPFARAPINTFTCMTYSNSGRFSTFLKISIRKIPSPANNIIGCAKNMPAARNSLFKSVSHAISFYPRWSHCPEWWKRWQPEFIDRACMSISHLYMNIRRPCSLCLRHSIIHLWWYAIWPCRPVTCCST